MADDATTHHGHAHDAPGPDAPGARAPGRHVRHGCFALDVPPSEAFVAFTARGEEGWVPGWRPRFHGPAADDAAPGTVFETDAHGHRTTWLVVDSEPGRRVRYARVTPGVSAGTVTVVLTPDGTGSTVDVTYELTALTPGGEQVLAASDASPAADPARWQEPVSAYLGRR